MKKIAEHSVVLVELNEINFDVVRKYIEMGEILPTFEKMFSDGLIETLAEKQYEELEPWIQWPSIHTGKSYQQHQIFRLGDIINSELPQIFELAEKQGLKVGAISPMNAANKLSSPAYFIPDPWTDTPADKSWMSQLISNAIKQSVNDNAQGKITLSTLASLILGIASKTKIKYWPIITKRAFWALKKPWRKAIFLDYLLHRIHIGLLDSNKVNFSTIFFNAGAHLQHHYFFNSAPIRNKEKINPEWYVSSIADPVLEILTIYDEILEELFSRHNTEVIVATGLSQVPYDSIKYYYRLNEHSVFLKKLGIKFKSVIPRMTRDFLVIFENEKNAINAEKILNEITVNNTKLFAEIDNRGKELFITLTYPTEITRETICDTGQFKFLLSKHVAFVAIKNGMHQSKGWFYSSRNSLEYKNTIEVTEIFNHLKRALNLA